MSFALAIGVGTQNSNQEWLEVFYPAPLLNPSEELIEAVRKACAYQGGNSAIQAMPEQLDALSQSLEAAGESQQAKIAAQCASSKRPVVVTILASDQESQTTPEVYLKLHLISHRLVKPHGLNLSGIFGLLPNVAWTNKGAIDLSELNQKQLEARLNGDVLEVKSVDKFPQMTDYVVPSGTRIADTSRVRLGAYIGEGTTIMHEGFVNFNAGTEGTSMIEGRISAGVVIGKGSDLGGGCSTMGTLSGGGNIIISVGENCLLGANAGIGIPLGDRCTVEAGLYITAGTKVVLLDDQNNPVETTKARELAGKSDLLFRRNSVNGQVECKTNKSAIELNEELHANN
ncbi:2,3,4, 5-tetrahydropyridine-2-carboxylate N-succinyltransferase [Oleiphilus messinensis]|uniref:2,3,4,5-tetrahydropyridine-2,6-dicarboxylate N-succinyltransferase n=2 Tax=Oleiphilus messinensis TaxID=141451 RepID=A0A1Y0I6B5_9GAMM|nr:2,3,4, 5-tetrahydropyridine-2-carboxylate N-succinyltransferase [Oleiphilus messinensis]